MPTNTIILSNAPIASVLAGNDISKGSLYGQRIDPLLDQKIYATYFVIKKIYDLNPNYSGITAACLYLWELMGKYGIAAQAYTGGGSVAIAGITTTTSFPIYITEANFTTATFYPNTNISGNNILIFYNQIPRYLLPDEFTISAAGITIDMPGFDATTQEIDLVIEKVY